MAKLQQTNFLSISSLVSEEEKQKMLQNIKQQNTYLNQQKKIKNTFGKLSNTNTQVTSFISNKKAIPPNE